MTTDESIQTSEFLLRTPPVFYNAKIPFKHWQLRSLLCSPATDTLYYPSNCRIYCLNTSTRKRRLVAALPFSPRCIGARYGWVCAGGADHGRFATIRVRRFQDGTWGPVDVTSDEADLARDDDGTRRRSSGSDFLNITELGGSIVNSVTLHRPPSSTSDDDNVLAILTNNDKTVRIFHLAENRVVTTLHVDVSTNHASISPDGQHLVVVGDSPEVYFYHPAAAGPCNIGSPPISIGEAGCGSWILSSHPPLSAGTDTDALMSTSFSSSSLHCAVGSQAGIITVFDTRYLSCEGGSTPLVKVITSSRPYTEAGAVRSVQFAPAPWDLLIWAEHCGRVCIADTRSDFARRQVVDVLAEKDDLIEAEVEDVQHTLSAWEISQNLQGNFATSRRHTREEDTEEEASSPETGRNAITELADLVLENSTEWLATYASRVGSPNTLAPHPPDIYASHLLRRHPPGSSLPATTPMFLRDLWVIPTERERTRTRIHPPRRRNSLHPSYTDQPASSQASSSSRTNVPTNPTERDRTRPPADSLNSPYARIHSLLAAYRRPQRVTGRLDAESYPFSYMMSDGVDITGCTLSPDGRKMFVATDGGVVEYGIDIVGRKVFPSICPR